MSNNNLKVIITIISVVGILLSGYFLINSYSSNNTCNGYKDEFTQTYNYIKNIISFTILFLCSTGLFISYKLNKSYKKYEKTAFVFLATTILLIAIFFMWPMYYFPNDNECIHLQRFNIFDTNKIINKFVIIRLQ